MLYRIKADKLEAFKNTVFGADCFLNAFPYIVDKGVELEKFMTYGNEFYYIMENGRKVNNTTFFSIEEMECMEPVT